jgi:hypothetical protein
MLYLVFWFDHLFLDVQAIGFILGVNPKSKIGSPYSTYDHNHHLTKLSVRLKNY